MKTSLLVVLALCAAQTACRRQPRPPVGDRAQLSKREPRPITEQRLTPDLALQTIESRYMGAMQRCYRARLKRDPAARGKLVVTFTVDDDGRVADGRAKGVAKSVERCVENAMVRWSFPAPQQETSFRLAFRLSSRT